MTQHEANCREFRGHFGLRNRRLFDQLDANHRVPFVPMSPAQRPSDWNYGSVQSIGGGFIIPGPPGADDEMLVFVGGGAGHSFQDLNATSTIGAASLRRDGFCSIDARDGGAPATLLTRPIVFSSAQKFLFVNADGAVGAEVLRGGDVLLQTAEPVRPKAGAGHTRLRLPLVDLQGKPATLLALRDQALQIRFRLQPGSKLFSFWLAEAEGGESGGFVAAGGPAFAGARDAVAPPPVPPATGRMGRV